MECVVVDILNHSTKMQACVITCSPFYQQHQVTSNKQQRRLMLETAALKRGTNAKQSAYESMKENFAMRSMQFRVTL